MHTPPLSNTSQHTGKRFSSNLSARFLTHATCWKGKTPLKGFLYININACCGKWTKPYYYFYERNYDGHIIILAHFALIIFKTRVCVYHSHKKFLWIIYTLSVNQQHFRRTCQIIVLFVRDTRQLIKKSPVSTSSFWDRTHYCVKEQLTLWHCRRAFNWSRPLIVHARLMPYYVIPNAPDEHTTYIHFLIKYFRPLHLI